MDARFPTRYLSDRRVMRLTAEHFRLFVAATAWSVTNRTDGEIEKADLELVPFASAADAAALVSAGLWTRTARGWLIVEYSDTQTSSAQLKQLDEQRQRDRERKARARKSKADDQEAVRAAVRRDVPSDVRPDVRPDITGKAKARTGSVQEQSAKPDHPELDVWNDGFPTCAADGCGSRLTHETQLPSGLCPQHFGAQLMTRRN